jgi:hypothetical protein
MMIGRTRGIGTGHSPRTVPVLVAAATAGLALALASTSPAATLQVCPSGCQYSQIAAAVAAAHSGDTITVAAGTYEGGFTIDVNLSLAGAGPSETIIKGGGPVVSIGVFGAAKEPTVSIAGLTITDGITRSSPGSLGGYGKAGVAADGGGVSIPQGAGSGPTSGPGATVTISDTVITDNRVAPLQAVLGGPPCPGGGKCPFAAAAGGGIFDAGNLTLAHTTISDNRVGSAAGLSGIASDADGGGIEDEGKLTVVDSTITGNEAAVATPNGRYADSGAISVATGTFTMRGSSVTDNSATVTAAWPSSVDTEAHAGAIHVMAGTATISHTKITGNTAKITNSAGGAFADSGGLKSDVAMTVTDDVITDNHVVVRTLGSGSAAGDSGAGELWGPVTGTRITDNTVTVTAGKGGASASSGASLITSTNLTNSVVDDNHVRAASTGGSASAIGGGIQVGGGSSGPVTERFRDTPISGNTATATGRTATAEGGGIVDIAVPNGPPGGPLVLIHSSVTHNAVSGVAGAKLQGGAVFTTFKLTLTDSALTGNTPSECAGMGC